MVKFVQATYVLTTFVHISNISHNANLILTKLLGPTFLGALILVNQTFLWTTFFGLKYFSDQHCFGQNIFWTKIVFRVPIFSLFKSFHTQNLFQIRPRSIVFSLVKMSISKIWKPNSCPENQIHARQKRLVFDGDHPKNGDHPKKISWLNWFLWVKTADQISASYLAQKWPKSLQWVGGWWWGLKPTLVFSLPSWKNKQRVDFVSFY